MMNKLPEPIPDPIFRIMNLAKERGNCFIDASMGVLCKSDGGTLVLQSTRKAVQACMSGLEKADFMYPDVLGNKEFIRIAKDKMHIHEDASVASFASAGGQGALKTNLELAKRMKIKNVLLPEPSWRIYDDLLAGSALHPKRVNYLVDNQPSIDPLLNVVSGIRTPTLLLLQGSGHNPLGKDYSKEQWEELCDGLKKSNIITLLDFAYQGLVQSDVEDVSSIQPFIRKNIPLLVAWSASKNHTLYSFRTGVASAIVESREQKRVVEGHYSSLSSEMQSVAPIPGQKVVSYVQKNLFADWSQEIEGIKKSIVQKRSRLLRGFSVELLRESVEGEGLYCILPLSLEQISVLRDKFGIYILEDGRVNISAIPSNKIEEFSSIIESVYLSI